MKTALALAFLALTAGAVEPHIVARWGGELVHFRLIATGQEWEETYEDFFAKCRGLHPNEVGVKVIGKLPASFLARERAAKLAKRQAPQPAPDIAETAPSAPPVSTRPPPAPKPKRGQRIVESPLPNFDGSEVVPDLPPLLLPQLPRRFSVITGERVPEEWESPAVELQPEEEPKQEGGILGGVISLLTGEPVGDEPERPKTREARAVEITGDYDVRKQAVVTSTRLDDVLEAKLAGQGGTIIAEARKNNLCPLFLAAVAIHESDNGKSKIVRERNNAFGICPSGSYARYDSIEENIAAAARLIGGKGYAAGGRFTIARIQSKYAPIGSNDPKNLNKHWTNGVVHHMKAFFGTTVHVVAN